MEVRTVITVDLGADGALGVVVVVVVVRGADVALGRDGGADVARGGLRGRFCCCCCDCAVCGCCGCGCDSVCGGGCSGGGRDMKN